MKPETRIVWRGASQLTGEPILVLLVHASGNGKTGAMSQAYILRADMTPHDAMKMGATSAICGDCPWQQNGCYAERSKGLIAIGSRASQDRPNVGAPYVDVSLDVAAESLSGRMLRLGAYGDPAAVPTKVWAQLCARATGWTGYTHQWRKCDPELRHYCMASCETPNDTSKAQASGWRTFRVRAVSTLRVVTPNGAVILTGDIEPLMEKEIVCPASAERDLVTCSECGLCAGTSKRGRNVAIINHSLQALAVRRRLGDLRVLQ